MQFLADQGAKKRERGRRGPQGPGKGNTSIRLQSMPGRSWVSSMGRSKSLLSSHKEIVRNQESSHGLQIFHRRRKNATRQVVWVVTGCPPAASPARLKRQRAQAEGCVAEIQKFLNSDKDRCKTSWNFFEHTTGFFIVSPIYFLQILLEHTQ